MRFLQLTGGLGFKMGDGDSRRVVAPEMGAREITLNYSVFGAGQEFPQHRHDSSEDCFIVLRGGASVREGDRYRPIQAGDAVWAPVGEVHGTVNTTDDVAVLISFQSPPDGALYRGERDTSHGTPPKPVPGAESLVRISRMAEVPVNGLPHGVAVEAGELRRVVSPGTGAAHLEVNHVSLGPGGVLSLEPGEHEQVLIVLRGDLTPQGTDKGPLTEGGVVFLEPGDALTLRAERDGAILVRAVATSWTRPGPAARASTMAS